MTAYFANVDFDRIDAEKWSSSSRQHNARAPYASRDGRYDLRSVEWRNGVFAVEPEGVPVDQINRFREYPWLIASDGRRIFSGLPLGPFLRTIALGKCELVLAEDDEALPQIR